MVNYTEEDEIGTGITKRVEVLNPSANNTPQTQSSLAFPFQLDPISTILLLPLLPFIQMMNTHIQMMSQLNNQNQNKTKITSITRNGNTLDIIEKWV